MADGLVYDVHQLPSAQLHVLATSLLAGRLCGHAAVSLVNPDYQVLLCIFIMADTVPL